MEHQYWDLGKAVAACDEEHANAMSIMSHAFSIWRHWIEDTYSSCAEGME